MAVALMRERAFPRTPDAGDCQYCPFDPLCDDRLRALPVAQSRAGAEFLAFKAGEQA
jgi:hypothetical protein